MAETDMIEWENEQTTMRFKRRDGVQMRIMLVDDEPFFIEILKKMIYRLQDELGIALEKVVECYSGQKALDSIPELQPDIVFTDIKMQAMDGIELAQTISHRWPQLSVVIISGYSSFDYARDALRANVMDYLVKPIEPGSVRNILERVKAKLAESNYERSRSMIQSILENDSSPDEGMACTSLTGYSHFCLLLIQKIDSALDKDLLMPYSDTEDQVWIRQLEQKLAPQEHAWLFHSNNRKEIIVLLGLQRFDKAVIKEVALIAQSHYAFSGVQASVTVSDSIAAAGDLNRELKKLHELLYRHIVIGNGKAIYCFENQSDQAYAADQLSNAEEKQITFAVEKKDWELLRRIIHGRFERWQQEQCPSLYVEMNLKRILYRLNLAHIGLDFRVSASLEKAIGEMVYTSSSYAEAGDAFWELLKLALKMEGKDNTQTSSEQLFRRIEHYILSNLSSPLSLTQLMEIFSVSSTHLCNIFRSFSGKSFVEYLTQLRIDNAQKLMAEHPEMPLKDIAELVSYTDRHYFTKVFKAITGKTPTEYKSSLPQ